ncbi:hypothetical protein Trydic_g5266 [Trypoxylus dichotomus]
MQISLEKAESMVIAKEAIICILALDYKPIHQRIQSTYLEVEITSSKNLQLVVRTQINKASRIFDYLRNLIWRNKYMSAESKVRIYKTAVRSVLIYAAETGAERTKVKKMMKTAEKKTLRAIKEVSVREQIRSKVIREDLEIQGKVRLTMGKMGKGERTEF